MLSLPSHPGWEGDSLSEYILERFVEACSFELMREFAKHDGPSGEYGHQHLAVEL